MMTVSIFSFTAISMPSCFVRWISDLASLVEHEAGCQPALRPFLVFVLFPLSKWRAMSAPAERFTDF